MKRLLLSISTILLPILAGAQIQLGIKAGLNLAKEGPTSYDLAWTYKTDINAGALAIIPLPGLNKSSLQPEIVYSGQGTKELYTGARGCIPSCNTNGDKTVVKLTYINIPVLLKYNITKGFFAEAGPQIGFLLSAKSAGIDVKSSSNSTDFSGVFGLDYLSSHNIGIDARFNLGFSGTSSKSIQRQNSGEPKFKNRVIQIDGFYLLTNKKKK